MAGVQDPIDGKLHLRIFVDRGSIEVFLNGTYHARYIHPTPNTSPIRLIAEGGELKFHSLKFHTLKSAWQ